MQNESKTKVITGKVRLSYAYLFEPRANSDDPNATKKYSTSIIIPKSDVETINKIKLAVKAAMEEGKSSKFGGKIPANLHTPLRDGDTERSDDPAYANAYFLNCSSATQPGMIRRDKTPITSEDELYSGVYAKVSITFYPYNSNGNKGIAAGLNNILKWEDGEKFSSRASADSDFADELDQDISDDELEGIM